MVEIYNQLRRQAYEKPPVNFLLSNALLGIIWSTQLNQQLRIKRKELVDY